jgi:hypothetical protein
MMPEQKQLLEGDEKREARNLPRWGWGDATSAPPRIAARIVEIRAAVLAGHQMPPPSAEYRGFAERAQRFEQRLFPQERVSQRAEPQSDKAVENLRRLLDAASIF